MPFIFAPLAAAIGGAIGLGAFGVAVIEVALAVGATVLIGALTPKPKSNVEQPESSSRGSSLNVKYGGSLPRQANLGRGATAGHLVYANVYDNPGLSGQPNETLQCVFVIGDGKHGHITRLWYNGKPITLPANPADIETNYYFVPELMHPEFPTVPSASLRYYNGDFDQTADSFLISRANPAGRWTSSHRGRGIAYIIVDQLYNEELELTGIPDLLIETEGLLLYDPRKDPAAGGSGTHVWGNISTYEPSNNPAIQEYNLRRGIFVGGQRLMGMTVSPTNLLTTSYFSAANVCDELVPIVGAAGTEPRYRCSIVISDDRTPADSIGSMNQAMAGMSIELGGRFGVLAGVAYALQADLEFTDDDLIVGEKTQFSKWRSRSEIVTAVHGRFSDPAQKWQPVSFPARINTADDTVIGERIAKEIDLTQVYSSTQAERLAEIERRRTLQLGSGTVVLPIRWLAATPGDWIRYNSARHGDMTVRVTALSIRQDYNVVLAYEKIASSVYTWSTGDEQGLPIVGIGGQPATQINQLTGVTAIGVNVPGSGTLVVPAIRFEWDPVFDNTVITARFEVRVQASPTQVFTFDFDFPAGGLGIAAAGIQANTVYEYRHKVVTFPDRNTVFSAWFTVTSGTEHVVNATATVADGGVTADALAAGAVTEAAIADAAVTAAKLHDDAVTATKFAAGIEPVAIVSSLPNPVGYTGPLTVFLTTDKKLYRYDAAIPAWTKAVDGVDITADSITAGQIAAGAISATELATNAVTADKILAGTIVASKLATGNFSNVVLNSDGLGFDTGTVTFGGFLTGATFGRGTTSTSPPGTRSFFVSFTGNPSGQNAFIFYVKPLISGTSDYFPASPGERWEFSGYLAAFNCNAWMTIDALDASLASLGSIDGNTISNNSPSLIGSISSWGRSGGFFTTPANTKYVRIFAVIQLTGGSNPSGYVVAPFMGRANPNQTVLSDWTPNGHVVIQGGNIVADSIIAGKLTTNSVVSSNIEALAITSGKLAAGSIYANDLFVDNVIIRGKLVADTATRVDAAQVGTTTFNMDTTNQLLVTLNFTSIGGTHVIDFSMTANWGFGFQTVAGTGNLLGHIWGVFIDLYIDDNFVRGTLCNPPFDGAGFTSGTVTSLRPSIRGHFRGLHQVTLTAGAHSAKLYAKATTNRGGTMDCESAAILNLEARR